MKLAVQIEDLQYRNPGDTDAFVKNLPVFTVDIDEMAIAADQQAPIIDHIIVLPNGKRLSIKIGEAIKAFSSMASRSTGNPNQTFHHVEYLDQSRMSLSIEGKDVDFAAKPGLEIR